MGPVRRSDLQEHLKHQRPASSPTEFYQYRDEQERECQSLANKHPKSAQVRGASFLVRRENTIPQATLLFLLVMLEAIAQCLGAFVLLISPRHTRLLLL